MEEIAITPEILLANGFVEYKTGDETLDNGITYPHDLPEYPEHDKRIFLEKEFHRNLFVIALYPSIIKDCLEYDVYVMNDVGCGFEIMPLRWVKLTVNVLNNLYMAFMNKKLINSP